MADDPTARFADVVAAPPSDVALDRACLLIAAHADPALDVTAGLAALDELAHGVSSSVAQLRARLFDEQGFAGDTTTYHDPANSLLSEVLRRRRGIPITLAVVAIEVGRRCGVPLEGVGMPGHFLVRPAGDPSRYFDVYRGGSELTVTGAQEIFTSLVEGTPWDDRFLDPVGPHAILARILANLVNAYRRTGDRDGLCWALQLRLLLPGASDRERRDLAVLLSASGRFDEAADALEEAGQARDLHAATRMRARLN